MGRDNEVDHLAIPAACFTHPEIAMVGLTEEQAKEKVTLTLKLDPHLLPWVTLNTPAPNLF